MLTVVNYIGRVLLCILIGSWAQTGVAKARNFNLTAGCLALSLALGFILNRWFKLDGLSSFVGIPAAAIIFTFVVEGIKKEIQKHTGQTST